MNHKIIGFQIGKDLRGNLATPVLQTIQKLNPREVISEAEKSLQIPLGARKGVHKTDITVQWF